ncbi:MAG: amidohydrolase [Flavobacteriales bacterium]
MTAKDQLAVTIVQSELYWEIPETNRTHFLSLLRASDPKSDVIVLPEMFTTGFSMKTELAEVGTNTLNWMRSVSVEFDAAVIGSVMTKEGEQSFNRLYVVFPSGEYQTYDKRHLFSFAQEHEHFTAGEDRLIVEFRGWKICPMICYDLRFPVWSRNAEINGGDMSFVYDLLIYVANWPEARRRPWTTLLEARAHENQAYVVGVNRVGSDGMNIEYSGDSAVFSPRGERLSNTEPYMESVETVILSKVDLDAFREKFTPWNDKDRFEIK